MGLGTLRRWAQISAFCLVSFWSTFSSGTIYEGKVVRIADGDTITVSAPGKPLKIRMVGLDAAEAHLSIPGGVVNQGRFGEAGTREITKMIPIGTSVKVDAIGEDKYHRILGRVYKDEVDINLAMIESGWAIPYIICEGKTCDKDFFVREKVSDYIAACRKAREKGLGLFDPKDPLKEMPFEFRLRMQHRKPDKFVGDFESGKLYPPADYKNVDLCQRIFFMQEGDAERAGYFLSK